MPTYTQANQPIEVITPLGKDVLLITSFRGEEAISRLFLFHIDMIADAKKEIAFDKLLGQKITVRLNLPGGKQRFFNGICNRIRQGEGDAEFISYHMEVVPQAWLLTKNAQSRIFQQLSVPDILKKVMTGVDVVWQIQGTFHPRNYCVQYRETDFNFASRLMEDEGIYYFFTHAADGHKMVVANTPSSHPAMPIASALTFEKMSAGKLHNDRVMSWQKQQELITGQHTLWDHTFEMHGRNLEAKKTVQDSVTVGKIAHKIKAGNADTREIYDFPGEYAQRFDGINPGGGEQAAEVKKILQDNERVAGIRSQQEAARALQIHGGSTCRNLVTGHKFTLQKHGHGDGEYLLTHLQHKTITPVDYVNAQAPSYQYANSFTAIPFALPFRPQRGTPKPFVQGTQTAVVVGPPGEEIFCDKYGRVKVQFHWDREGKLDAKSSCWVRVSTLWAGKGWGIVTIPRIGHEVIVGFEEGDPDQPIILGNVYNADHMPPGTLPKDKMVSGLKSNSTPGGGGYNGMVCNDTKGKEGVTIHAQYNMDTTVENDQTTTVHNNRTDKIDVDDSETIGSNQKLDVGSNRTVTIGADQSTKIGANDKLEVGSNQEIQVKSNQSVKITGNQTQDVGGNQKETIGGERDISVSGKDGLAVGGTQTIKVTGAIKISSDASIELVVGGSGIKIEPAGITIKTDAKVTIEAGAKVEVKGATIASEASAIHELKGATIKLN
ncbi:MAG: type VI secretion system tip protein VgrG [Planctomycetes bacterium]|nr:type VI secretion system tip protein VgrG [Planctomycetota bacterium]